MSERILIVSRHFWPENYRINEICRQLAAAGYKTDVLCGQPSRSDGTFFPGYNSFKVRRESRGKINIFRSLDVSSGSGSNIRIFLNYIVFPLAGLFASRKLMNYPYSAVLVFQTNPVMQCLPAVRIARKKQIPLYIYAADLWPESLFQKIDVQSSLFRKFLELLSVHYYKKADKILVPSAKIRDYFIARTGKSREHFPVVPLFPDPRYETNEPDDDLLEKLAASFNVFIYGDFDQRLSAETVIQTARLVRQANIRNIRFVVTGAGTLISSLEQMVKEEELRDYFYFEGALSSQNIGKYIHVTDLILAAVKPEAVDEYMIPHRLITFMAAGKPMVVSLSGLVKQLFKDAGCGFSTEPFDAQAVFDGIMNIYRMPAEKRTAMGQQCRNYQETHFSLDQCTEQLLSVLRKEQPEDEKSQPEIRQLWDL